MISNSVIVSMFITIILATAGILVPFFTVFFTARKKETGLVGSLGLGVLGYFWAQFLLPLPVLFILTKFTGFMKIYNNDKYFVVYLLITAVLLSVLSALARLWCVWLMNKRTPSLYRAVCSGIGFAIFQVLSIVGSYFTYIKYANILNKADGASILAKSLKASNPRITDADIDKIIQPITSARVDDILFEGINVIFVIIIEIALITLVYEGLIRKKKWLATLICAGINVVFSFLTMLFSELSGDKLGLVSKGVGTIIYNAFMLICGLAAAWFVYGALQRYKVVFNEGPYAHYTYFEKKDEKNDVKNDEINDEKNDAE